MWPVFIRCPRILVSVLTITNPRPTKSSTITAAMFGSTIVSATKIHCLGATVTRSLAQSAPNPLVGGQGTCCLPTPASAASKFDLGPFVAGIQDTTLIAQGLALNETHVFSPTVVNEFRTGYSRTNPFTFQSDYGHNSSTSLGIEGLNVTKYATGLPNLTIGSSCGSEFTCLQGGLPFCRPTQFRPTFSLKMLSRGHGGRHQLKLGGRYIKQMASPFTNTTTRGGFTFNDNFTDNPAHVTGTGSGLAGLLFGFPNSGSRNYLQQTYFVTDGEWAAYAQDDWKASSRLTVNAGVRYEVYTPEAERHNRLANFDYSTLKIHLCRAQRREPPRRDANPLLRCRAAPGLCVRYERQRNHCKFAAVSESAFSLFLIPPPMNSAKTLLSPFLDVFSEYLFAGLGLCDSMHARRISDCPALSRSTIRFPRALQRFGPASPPTLRFYKRAAPAIISHQLSINSLFRRCGVLALNVGLPPPDCLNWPMQAATAFI